MKFERLHQAISWGLFGLPVLLALLLFERKRVRRGEPPTPLWWLRSPRCAFAVWVGVYMVLWYLGNYPDEVRSYYTLYAPGLAYLLLFAAQALLRIGPWSNDPTVKVAGRVVETLGAFACITFVLVMLPFMTVACLFTEWHL